MNGNNVYLRSIEDSDIALVRTWNFDPEISAFFDSRLPISLNEQRKWFEGQIGSASKKKLIIVDKESEQAVGMVGIMSIDHQNKNCEIGITIGNKNYWGKPHAAEAMSLTLRFLFEDFNMHIIYLRVFADNVRGVRFFEKMGFCTDGILRNMVFKGGKYHNICWMSISQDEFQSRSNP